MAEALIVAPEGYRKKVVAMSDEEFVREVATVTWTAACWTVYCEADAKAKVLWEVSTALGNDLYERGHDQMRENAR